MNIANKITLLRLFALPFFLFLLSFEGDFYKIFNAGFYLIICFTDFLDGYLARKLNIITDFGKFLDPLVDKAVVILPLIFFIESGLISAWAVSLLVFREFFITSFRLIAMNKGLVISADNFGKIKTVLQMTTVFLLILNFDFAFVFVWLTVIITLLSGAIICIKNKQVFLNF